MGGFRGGGVSTVGFGRMFWDGGDGEGFFGIADMAATDDVMNELESLVEKGELLD